MKSIKKLGFLALLAGVSWACNKNPPTNQPYGTSLTVTQGTFVETKEVAATETPLHANCATTGGVIDSRLKAGDTFESTYKAVNGSKVSKVLSIRARVASLDASNLKEEVMPISASGVTVQLGQELPLTCAIDAQGKGSCTQPDFIGAVAATTNGSYNNCQLTGDDSDIINQRSSIGTFKLVSGQSFAAYLITRLTQGNLLCNGRAEGKGDLYETVILSNAVPAEGAASACGGTQVFHSEAYRNNQKRVMLGSSFERTLIP